MKAHFLGRERNLESEWGTSLAVLQFVELARGERTVMRPHNLFRVDAVRAEEHYCLHCFGVHWFDVVYGVQVSGARCQVKRCRFCGTESGG